MTMIPHPEAVGLLKIRAYLLESIAMAADDIRQIDNELATLQEAEA
jgi:hypothetical protein